MHLPDVDAARIAYLGLDDATDVQELDQAELLARAETDDVVVLDVRSIEEQPAGEQADEPPGLPDHVEEGERAAAYLLGTRDWISELKVPLPVEVDRP